jgi:WD40 repeat protein
LVTSWQARGDRLHLWPVAGNRRAGPRFLELSEGTLWTNLKVANGREFVLAVGDGDRADVVPLDGSAARRMDVFSEDTALYGGAISPSGRRVATAFSYGTGDRTLRVWDLDRDILSRLDLPESESTDPDGEPLEKKSGYEGGILDAVFFDESTLYTGGDGGVRRWDLERGTQEVVFATRPGYSLFPEFDAQGQTALVSQFPLSGELECGPIELVDLRSGSSRPLPSFGDCPYMTALALGSSGSVAATGGSRDGLVRVGRVDGGEPHVLAGHEGTVQAVAISPDLRWVASAGEDSTLRIWPAPDLDQPPLHTLPREALLTKLKSMTNFRAVRHPEAPDGWKIELGPFPGWKDVPTW